MTDTATKRVQKPRDVDYTLEIVDDLPDLDVQRRSPLTDQINRVVNTPASHNKFVRIGWYANGSAASAAANVLRKKYGDTEAVEGWTIRAKRSDKEVTDEETGAVSLEPRTGLFVRFNPEAIVPGAKEDFDVRSKEREARIAEKRALRDSVDTATEAKAPKTRK